MLVGLLTLGLTKSLKENEMKKVPTLQAFTAQECALLTVCPADETVNCDTNGSTVSLRDERDNKVYRVRKFADNNCWMIDNLAYGGGVKGKGDNCQAKTVDDWRVAFNEKASTPVKNEGLNSWKAVYVGDCLNPALETGEKVNPCADETANCGYLYNFIAATQDPAAYAYNDHQVVEPTTGICPEGWQLPTVEGNKSFYNLHLANGFEWDIDLLSGTGATGFWQEAKKWNATTSGLYMNDPANTGLVGIGEMGAYWTTTQWTPGKSFIFNFLAEGVAPTGVAAEKNYGAAVRCVLK